MAVKLRTKRPDSIVRQIANVLSEYESEYPNAKIEIYRYNSASVRIRILDPEFEDLSRVQREDRVWPLLDKLSEETVSDITMLVLLTPEEAKSSFANQEFEDPIPSPI